MSRTVETEVYLYAELSSSAKERARQWWVDAMDSSDYAEYVVEDAARIAELMGIEFKQRRFKPVGGQTWYEPCVWWSLFSQGSGASFEGTYRPKDGSFERVKEYAPQDERLHGIAQAFDEAFKLGAEQMRCSISTRGNYSHSYTMQFEFDGADDAVSEQAFGEAEKLIIEACRNFADWIYRQIEAEYEYRCSEEAVAEACEANEYTFLESGERWG